MLLKVLSKISGLGFDAGLTCATSPEAPSRRLPVLEEIARRQNRSLSEKG